MMKRTLIVVLTMVMAFSVVGVAGAQDGGDSDQHPIAERLLYMAMIRQTLEATDANPAELMEALADGQTLAEFITANGGDPDQVAAAAQAVVEERLNDQLARQQEQVTDLEAMITELPNAVNEAMNTTEPPIGDRNFGPGQFFGPGMRGRNFGPGQSFGPGMRGRNFGPGQFFGPGRGGRNFGPGQFFGPGMNDANPGS